MDLANYTDHLGFSMGLQAEKNIAERRATNLIM